MFFFNNIFLLYSVRVFEVFYFFVGFSGFWGLSRRFCFLAGF